MTLEEFQSLKELQDHRVQMTFSDGQVVIANLISATVDLDETRHIIYDHLEWSALPHLKANDNAWYASGDLLVSCVACPDAKI